MKTNNKNRQFFQMDTKKWYKCASFAVRVGFGIQNVFFLSHKNISHVSQRYLSMSATCIMFLDTSIFFVNLLLCLFAMRNYITLKSEETLDNI